MIQKEIRELYSQDVQIKKQNETLEECRRELEQVKKLIADHGVYDPASTRLQEIVQKFEDAISDHLVGDDHKRKRTDSAEEKIGTNTKFRSTIVGILN